MITPDQGSEATPGRDALAHVRALERTTVLVVGGGINGIATFRDLALQHVDVVLVERSDFASGATAASSHMIHGGLRYLENGELRLVRESVQERNRLLRLAPHFVEPLRTTIPIFSTFSGMLAAPLKILRHSAGRKHRQRGAAIIKVGLRIYDTFSRDNGSVPRHEFLGRRASRDVLPALNPDVKYTATYYDAVVHSPERLALDVLVDGLDAHDGAHAVNYVEAVGIDDAGVRLRDLRDGHEFTLGADVVVNASGPWTDLTNNAFGSPTAYMGGTKGSHIVLDHPELLAATGGREIFFENADGRIVLIHPLHDRILVGTTDVDADPREPAVCTEDEIEYFLELISQAFPDIAVDRADIVFHYSGIRPLPHHGDASPGVVSRDYRIEVDESRANMPVLSLIGGKWTTFRALGETLSSRVLALLGRERTTATSDRAIGGGRDYPATTSAVRQWQERHLAGIDEGRREALFARYGTRAREAAPYVTAQSDRPIADGQLSSGELAYMVRREQVEHVSDVCLRRTNLAFTGKLTHGDVEEIATALAPELHWDEHRVATEVSATVDELTRRHGMRLEANAQNSTPRA